MQIKMKDNAMEIEDTRSRVPHMLIKAAEVAQDFGLQITSVSIVTDCFDRTANVTVRFEEE